MNLSLPATMLVAALSIAPDPKPEPVQVKAEYGEAVVCMARGGCYIMNGAGLDDVIKQTIDAAKVRCRPQT